jgi:hypothetical protein
MAAPTNTKKDKQNIMDAANAAALKAEEMSKAGGIPMDGLSPTGTPQSTIGMSKSEKFFSQGRALDKSQLEGYKSSGDKGAGEGMNAIRAAQGRPTVANTPKEFSDTINKSVGFGSESKLLDQAGRDRALKAGIGAGLSYEEADAAVSKAYNFLKGKYGDKTTPTTPTTTTTPKPDETTTTSTTSASSSPTIPPIVPVEKGLVAQVMGDVLSGGGVERSLVKGGSLFLKGTKEAQAAKAAAEAAAKAGGAVGNATKPFNMVDDATKTAAEGLKQKYNIAKPVGGASKPFSMLDDVAKAAGAAGDAVKPFNMVDDATKTTAEALEQMEFDFKDPAAAGAADGVTGAADEAAGAADEAVKAAEKGKGAVSRILKGAAESRLGKLAATTARVGGKGLRFVGRAAGPALEIYDAGRYFTGDQEVKDQYAKDVETLGQRVFQPKSFGEFAGGVGDVLSPTKNVLGTAEAVSQLLKSQRGAREADASLKNAQNVIKAQNDRRKELYPDEEFDKLPKETQRKIKQAIRKEFRDAGVQTFGRKQ